MLQPFNDFFFLLISLLLPRRCSRLFLRILTNNYPFQGLITTFPRALRRVFVPKRDEVRGKWRKLCNEELSDLYSLPNIVQVVNLRRMRWVGHVAHMGEGRGVHRVLVGKPEGKRPMGRPSHRWEDNIKMDLQVVGTGWSWLRIGTGGRHL